MTCQQKLKLEGKPYPRTCHECGLGPCKEPNNGRQLLAVGDYVETTKGAQFWGRILSFDGDPESPGCTVKAVHPEFYGTKHVYPTGVLRIIAVTNVGGGMVMRVYPPTPRSK